LFDLPTILIKNIYAAFLSYKSMIISLRSVNIASSFYIISVYFYAHYLDAYFFDIQKLLF